MSENYEAQSIDWGEEDTTREVGQRLFFCYNDENGCGIVPGIVQSVDADGGYAMKGIDGNEYIATPNDERFVKNMGAAKEYLKLYQ